MKRVQKLFGLCLIGSLLAVHPISGADLPGILYLAATSFSMNVDNKNISDEISDDQIKEYMNKLCFELSYIQSVLHSYPPIYQVGFRSSAQECITFFDEYKQKENDKNRLRRCAEQLLQEKGFEAREFESIENPNLKKDELKSICKRNEKYHEKWIVSLNMLHWVVEDNKKIKFSHHGYDDEEMSSDFMIKLYEEVVGNLRCNVKSAKKG